MNAVHTPGPWRTGDVFNTVFGPPNGQPAPETVAYVHRGRKANARLIAAAPDLLEACERVLKGTEWLTEEDFEFIHAAVAKAKGQP